MRRRGLPLSGFVLLDKPAGLGSTQAVAAVRRATGAAKAGHGGTLDPAATGLLVVALGEATKALPAVADAPKAYDFAVRWGAETDTDDAEGRVTATSEARPTEAAILAALGAFRGDILQTPPAYSAVKVGGARAYALARAGEAVALAARPLHVVELELTGRPDADRATFRMTCGKGGYVRGIARDLGRALGCLGHVEGLRRLWSGPFALRDAAGWEALGPDLPVLPLERGLHDVPQVRVDAAGAHRLRQGQAAMGEGPAEPGEAWASEGGRAVALGPWDGVTIRPRRVIL